MTAIDRRRFLKHVAAGAIAAGGLTSWPRIGAPSPWGCASPACGLGGLRVLEIFCYGGMSQWENFWVSEDLGVGLNWRGFHDEVQALEWSGCDDAPASATETRYFADADAGAPGGGGLWYTATPTIPVHWGPATRALWPLMPYVRAVVVKPGDSAGVHGLGIHKGLTGRRLGDPRAAGLGAAIQHQAQSIQPQTLPYSYVLAPKDPGSFGYVANYATSAGRHPGSATPLAVKLGGDGFGDLLSRAGLSPERDNVLAELRAQYRDLLRFQGAGAPVRARDWASFDASAEYARTATAELEARIGGDALALETSDTCVLHPEYSGASRENATRRSIELAAYLLKHAGARYVGVIDGGIARTPEGDSPYDTHCNGRTETDGTKTQTYSHVQVTSANLWNVLDALGDVLTPPSTGSSSPPSEYATPTLPEEAILPGSPIAFGPGSTISLANTLVVINTEFNRTPYAVNFGRNHSEKSGHVALLIGGPVAGGTIAGRIGVDADDGPESAVPVGYATPTDVHAAVLDAMGIDIWSEENFRASDEFGPVTKPAAGAGEDDIRDNIRSHVLGLA